MVQIQIDGVGKVLANLNKIQENIQRDTRRGLIGAANKLRDAAIIDLQSKLGTSNPMWGPWGHSAYHQAISDKESWVITYPNQNSVELESRSQHSAIVELGGNEIIQASSYGHGAWPIGKNQGWNENNIIYKPTFKLQRGYHYLTASMNNPSVINNMITEVGNVLRDSINSVKG